MMLRIGVAAVLAFVLAGCSVPSLSPLYRGQDIVFDPAFTGEWLEPGTKARTTIRQGEGKAYEITHRDEDRVTYRYSGNLFRLRDQMFMSLFPVVEERRMDDMGYIPVHNVYRVALDANTLRFGGLRVTWLRNALAQKKISVAHALFRPPGERQELLLLTGSTSELQDFLREISKLDEAFYDSKLERRK